MKYYRDNQVEPTPPSQLRDDRPNPRWAQCPEVEVIVARVRAIIASNPAALYDIQSPVTHVVEELVDDAWTAARVVEGVLADSACRFMLNKVGLHGGDSTRKRRAKA